MKELTKNEFNFKFYPEIIYAILIFIFISPLLNTNQNGPNKRDVLNIIWAIIIAYVPLN